MNHQLREAYSYTLQKYRKYKSRFERGISDGHFYRFSKKKQQQILRRLERLKNRLSQLKLQLKLGAAGVAVAGILSVNSANAQELGPFIQNDNKNPFGAPTLTGTNKKLTYADLDNDGDLDLAIGISTGVIQYFENIGGASAPLFNERTGAANPFDAISFSTNAAPELIDFDGDGDFDLIVAFTVYSEDLRYYENDDFQNDGIIGNNPTFTLITSPGSPIENVVGNESNVKSTIVDLDNDGDFDILLGQNSGPGNGYVPLSYFRNDLGTFSAQALPPGLGAVPFGFGDPNIAPTFHDLDGDLDYDLFIGAGDGTIRFVENIGTVSSPSFSEVVGAGNPFNGVDVGSNSVITFADLDNDGDEDASIGSSFSNSIRYYENDGTGNFNLVNGFSSPFQELYAVNDIAPTALIDLDGDTFVDVVMGQKYSSTLLYFENSQNGSFTEKTGVNNPFENILGPFDRRAVPSFADIDADGDQDLFVSVEYYTGFPGTAQVLFFENDGSNNFTPTPTPITKTQNTTQFATTHGDFDNDGDFDAIIGSNDINYTGASFLLLQNDGDASSPNFVEQPIFGPPFNGVDVGSATGIAKPVMIDIDHDGDKDVVSGIGNAPNSGELLYFENDSGVLTLQIGVASPFFDSGGGVNFDFGTDSHPTLMDTDNDGDLDVLIGLDNGRITFLENQNIPPQVNSLETPITFTEGGTGILDAALTLSDDGNDNIIGASIEITNFISEDILTFTPQFGITGNYSNGVLSLSGSAQISEYEIVLQSVSYGNTNDTPDLTPRNVQFSVTDFDATDPFSDSFPEPVIVVNIVTVNDPPVITSAAGTSATEDVEYLYTPTVVDPDDTNNGIELTWSLSNEPAGMVVSTIGEVTWTPAEGVLSSGPVTLSVQDGGENGTVPFSEVFTILVTPVNDSPVITSTAGTSATEKIDYTYTPTVDDSDDTNDGTNLTWSLAGQPTGMTVDAFGVVSWTPTVGVGTSGAVTLTVQDGGEDGSVPFSEVFTITVLPTTDNELPVISGSSGDLAYRSLTGAIIVDDQITLSDIDDEDLVGATVQVASGYSPIEDVLTFLDQNGISGTFNSVTGILTLTGTSSIANYETALRSITYENSVAAPSAASKPMEFVVSDAIDASTPFSRTVVIASNQVIAEQQDIQVEVGSVVTIDVITGATFTIGDIITTEITIGPGSGTAVVNPDGSIQFTPDDNVADGTIDALTYELCNEYGSCGINTINITISNSPPVINLPPTEIEPGGTATVPLVITDQNGNFNPNSVIVTEQPLSGLPVTIDGDLNLIIDYSASGFQGADHIIIQVCDLSGACTVFDVVIVVGEVNEVLIYNGVTPNDDGINDELRILDIEFFPENEIFVYNKLGRLVYNVQNYDNNSVVFSGLGDDGNELEDGTYYYVIVLIDPERKKLRQSGYIVLRR